MTLLGALRRSHIALNHGPWRESSRRTSPGADHLRKAYVAAKLIGACSSPWPGRASLARKNHTLPRNDEFNAG
jgi:hypothetical protein